MFIIHASELVIEPDSIKKCARCWPSNSSPDGDQHEFNGTVRWKLNVEICFGTTFFTTDLLRRIWSATGYSRSKPSMIVTTGSDGNCGTIA